MEEDSSFQAPVDPDFGGARLICQTHHEMTLSSKTLNPKPGVRLSLPGQTFSSGRMLRQLLSSRRYNMYWPEDSNHVDISLNDIEHCALRPAHYDVYSPTEVDRILGIWGSYHNIPQAIFHLLKGDFSCFFWVSDGT